jgi:hypothetical protein
VLIINNAFVKNTVNVSRLLHVLAIPGRRQAKQNLLLKSTYCIYHILHGLFQVCTACMKHELDAIKNIELIQ